MTTSCLSVADTWGTIRTRDTSTWYGTGLDQFAATIAGMYPAEAAEMRSANFEGYAKYKDRPIAYIREVLKIEPTPKQEEIAKALLAPPYKVIVVSCNNYGKSHLAGGLVNWYYDSHDPGLCITTAPRLQDVVEVLWKEVRSQRRTRGDFRGDMAPKLYSHPLHYAEGYTGSNVTAFHGRHDDNMFFILDEATAIKSFVWTGIKSMFKPTGRHHLLALLNPTDTTSPAYAEAQSGNYTIIRLSALEHPNVIAELKGQQAPIRGAVDTLQLCGWFEDPLMFEEIHPDDFETGDVLWPPAWADKYGALKRYTRDGKTRLCYRPGPEGQARALGLWPTSSPGAVWSDIAWQAATRSLDGWQKLKCSWTRLPEIGCDVASGTAERGDKAEIICQCEGIALHWRGSSGWTIPRIAAECEAVAEQWARIYNERRNQRETQFARPQDIPIKIDDGGLGCGVTQILLHRGFRAIPINAGTTALNPHRYPLMRDELWFSVPLAAARGEIDLSYLPARVIAEARRQALAVMWKPDLKGRRKVEDKNETKKRINRSPDTMDALNLAYARVPSSSGAVPAYFSNFQGSLPSMQPEPEPGVFGG